MSIVGAIAIQKCYFVIVSDSPPPQIFAKVSMTWNYLWVCGNRARHNISLNSSLAQKHRFEAVKRAWRWPGMSHYHYHKRQRLQNACSTVGQRCLFLDEEWIICSYYGKTGLGWSPNKLTFLTNGRGGCKRFKVVPFPTGLPARKMIFWRWGGEILNYWLAPKSCDFLLL